MKLWLVVMALGFLTNPYGTQSANSVVSYNNALIADMALGYVGQWGGEACRAAGKLDNGNIGSTVGGFGAGQCKTFVNCIVFLASNGGQYPVGVGGDYFQSFLNAGGQEITDIGSLVKGDIVQVGQGIHTFIIVSKVSANKFNVADSNHDPAQPEKVLNYDRTFTLDSNTRAFRMGTASSTSTGPLTAVQSVSVGPSDRVAMYTPIAFSYRVNNTSGAAASIQKLVVAVRGPAGNALDVPCANGNGVTLTPGQEWTCDVRLPTGYGSTGQFRFWADWLDYGGKWHEGQLGSSQNYLYVGPAMTLTTVQPISVGPSNYRPKLTPLWWSYRVRNTSGSWASIQRIVVAVRGPAGDPLDLACDSGFGVTLAPFQEWTCSVYLGTGYGSTGTFRFWADWLDYGGRWHTGELGGVSPLTLY